MPRVFALLLALLLVSCSAPPSAPVSGAVISPLFQPTLTTLPTTIATPTLPAPLPTVTPVLPTATPLPPTATPLPPTPPPATAVLLPRYDLVLAGGTLIAATGVAPLPNAAVAIQGGRIVAIGRVGELAYSADTPVRNVSGGTIMPGFINAHVHISGLTDDDLRRWTRAGVTTVRDLAGELEERVTLRNRLGASNDPTLPRLLVTGPIVTVAAGYPFSINDARLRVPSLAVSGPRQAYAATVGLIAGGVDQVKIAVSGRTDVHWPELSDAEIAAITEAARANGVAVTAHVDRAAALQRAVLQGISDAAHSPRDRVPDEVFALMVQRGVTLVPTIAVYEALARSRGGDQTWRHMIMPIMHDNLRRFVAAGGTLALGDDFGGVPGMPVGMPMDEIRHWLAAGLSPMQVIEAGTRGSATAVGLVDQLGTVEVGKVADLLVVQGDPLSDMNALQRPMLVIHAGQPLAP